MPSSNRVVYVASTGTELGGERPSYAVTDRVGAESAHGRIVGYEPYVPLTTMQEVEKDREQLFQDHLRITGELGRRVDAAERRAIEAEAKLAEAVEKLRAKAEDAVDRRDSTGRTSDISLARRARLDGRAYGFRESADLLATLADSDPPACNCGSNVEASWHNRTCPIYKLDHPDSDPPEEPTGDEAINNMEGKPEDLYAGVEGEEETDRWPVLDIIENPGSTGMSWETVNVPGKLRINNPVRTKRYFPESAPNVLTPDEARLVVEALAPLPAVGHRERQRLFDRLLSFVTDNAPPLAAQDTPKEETK